MTGELPEGREERAGPVPPAGLDADGEGGNGAEPLDRLPPPAFPSDQRRTPRPTVSGPAGAESVEPVSADTGPAGAGRTDSGPKGADVQDPETGEEAGSEIPDDAFISPDDPIRRGPRGVPDDAFISPDEPLVPVSRDDSGTVVGIGVRAARPPSARSRLHQGPTVLELPYLLDQLAEQLHESGERALEVNAEMGHFQAALRSFLKGYLEGSRD